MRLHELALRKVNGATDRQIAATLYTDFLLIILLSLVVGFMLMTWLLPSFREYVSIGNGNVKINTELALYAVLLIACGFVTGGIPILYFRKQVLTNNIKGSGSSGSRNLFRKGSLLVQLIVSLGLMFCSVVFVKQMHFLQHTDLGINRRNIASVNANCCPLLPPFADRIKQVTGIIDAIPIGKNNFLRDMESGSFTGNITKDETYTLFTINADARFFDFFGVEIIEGTTFSNAYDKKFVLTETAIKEVGELFSKNTNFMGVARDFYLTPTTKAKQTYISYPDPKFNLFNAIAYKHEEGMRQQTEQSVTKWLREEFPDQGEFGIDFTYMEDIFNEYFKSERALLTLLSVMTFACTLIAIFGVFSLASLSCEQRSKEIAIRKINGAEVFDIMNIFFKEYLLLLVLAAFMAFPAGYVIMKRWMEGYVKQTSMDAWLFVLIFLSVFIIIVLTIISMVWKTANRNPAKVVISG
jgi:hypothetical protein